MDIEDLIDLITFAAALFTFGFRVGCVYSELTHNKNRFSLRKDKRS